MLLIGLYLSMSEWYTVCNKLLQAGEIDISAHILDEIGYCLDVAPQYYKPRFETCDNCNYRYRCRIATAKPLCKDYKKAVYQDGWT